MASYLHSAPALGRLILAAALGLCACNFEVPSSSYIAQTKLLTVLVEVVELSEVEPINPYRVGAASEVPIAEAMPHDTVRFEAFVVDRNGERIPSAELDSVWFQCAALECGSLLDQSGFPLFDVDCTELEDEGLWDMDAICRLGQGDGEFETVLPELGPGIAENRIAAYYGVIAWEGRSAESCWSARRSGTESLDRCGFIQRAIRIGPSWWMLAVYADALGIETSIPVHEIPAPVFLQAANRVPVVRFPVTIDGELRGTWPEQTQFEVEPGAAISIDAQYDEATQFLQTYFTAGQVDAESESYVFRPAVEGLGEVPFSTNAIVWRGLEGGGGQVVPPTWELVVDDLAKPGRSRVFLVYFDDRFAEGVATFEFEVQP